MADAPERIWLLPHDGEQRCWCDHPDPSGMGHEDEADEYIRADLVEALEAENQRLREALRPFGDAKDHAIESVGKTTTLGVLGAIAPYFLTWQDFSRARAVLRSTEEGVAKSGSSKWGPDFPPSDCTAWEDCHHDGVCHDADCSARLRTEANHDD